MRIGSFLKPGLPALVAGLGLLAPTGAAAQQGPENGSLVIVGGALRDEAILERFLDLAGGARTPRS